MSRYGKCSEIDQDIVRIEERSANSQGNDQEHGSSRRCQFDPHRALDHQFLDSLIKAGGGDCIAKDVLRSGDYYFEPNINTVRQEALIPRFTGTQHQLKWVERQRVPVTEADCVGCFKKG